MTFPPAIPPISADLIDRYGGPAPRYTSYPTVPHWQLASGSQARRRALASADPAVPLSLYVHIPFCEKMCDFCGCNVIVRRDRSAADGYLTLLHHEIEALDPVIGRRPAHALHLGGGTPTFLTVPQLERLMATIQARFDFEPGADLSIEVNPTSTSVEQIVALAGLGFRRISLGVQDTNPGVLAGVGRAQTSAKTLEIIAAARGAGFTSVNVDLIYGLPGQTVRSWAGTLDQLAELEPDRVAVFGFAYVPDLRPNQRRLDAHAMPPPVTKVDLYRQAYQLLVARGYVPIGLDHFARPHDPLAQAALAGTLGRNFQGYVADARGDLLGLGVSSISDVNGVYAQNFSSTARYRDALANSQPTLQRACRPTPDDVRLREAIVTLMCHQPLDLTTRWRVIESPAKVALANLAADGLIEFDGRHIGFTPISRPFLRHIAAALDPAMHAAATPRHSQL